MNRIFNLSAAVACLAATAACGRADYIGFTVIPPVSVTTQVDLDVRVGIINNSAAARDYTIQVFCDDSLICETSAAVGAGEPYCLRHNLETANLAGTRTVCARVKQGKTGWEDAAKIDVIQSDIRSTRKIEGAFMGFYHWSDQEGKMWNPTIKTLDAAQWQEVASSMHKLDMDIVVMQESFRNQEYVGQHNMETDGYHGRAFYDSQLYPDRMPIACPDPIEAVMTQADSLGMHVFAGVGMYAWFDYTPASLEWHEAIARELWEKYGHHESFYGFYVSEEGMGSLDCFETDPAKVPMRQQEMLSFYKEMGSFCHALAPDKPLMFAPNGWGVGRAFDLYPTLLASVDIICPFAFARMPEGDLTGPEAVGFLQKSCNDAGAHLWFDLEAFLFDETEGYLVPRPIDEIVGDLYLFDTFEKVVTYQYPGVFNDPEASVCIGEESTLGLFEDYRNYIERR